MAAGASIVVDPSGLIIASSEGQALHKVDENEVLKVRFPEMLQNKNGYPISAGGLVSFNFPTRLFLGGHRQGELQCFEYHFGFNVFFAGQSFGQLQHFAAHGNELSIN